ncbi:MAG: 3-phosphoserine/phosphohydroxythreonine aminotransferase [Flavobacteriales bacterium]|nr:3-phosphoserine/phosphohydroxythreonine aminotransferase [Flavobacteriales bacterium]|tara:strand:+ start:887 stop:1945 length:1059 start_codon:yes stop_codon:yes gene_type:complete
MTKHNFGAGPCILPKEVLKLASESIINFNEIDLSILEISHRSQDFINVIEKAKKLVIDLLNVPNNYSILFLQGGASLQFFMSALNLLKKDQTAGYINTGSWSKKALLEAKKIGNVEIIASSEEKGFSFIPRNINISDKISYVHFTSNNTIYGTQFHSYPKRSKNCFIVSDMSSDIFSKKINISDFDIIYAGAQKNIGPAGTTLVIINNEVLNINSNLPSMLDYSVHVDKSSMFNTPPVFSIYVSMLTLQWLKKMGGINKIEKINDNKSRILYDAIDESNYLKGYANKADRSKMNVTFTIENDNKKKKFDEMCQHKSIVGIKGHRSVGGYRASLYNALEIDSVNVLVDIIKSL